MQCNPQLPAAEHREFWRGLAAEPTWRGPPPSASWKHTPLEEAHISHCSSRSATARYPIDYVAVTATWGAGSGSALGLLQATGEAGALLCNNTTTENILPPPHHNPSRPADYRPHSPPKRPAHPTSIVRKRTGTRVTITTTSFTTTSHHSFTNNNGPGRVAEVEGGAEAGCLGSTKSRGALQRNHFHTPLRHIRSRRQGVRDGPDRAGGAVPQ